MHFLESALRRVVLIACSLVTIVPAVASASARVTPGELRRDGAEAAFGREGGQDGATPAPTVRANRISQPLRVDGKLEEESYKIVPAITGFVQQEPDEFKPATERTEAWIFFDDDNIYISARNWESHPERRVANEMRRDTGQLRQNDTFRSDREHRGVDFFRRRQHLHLGAQLGITSRTARGKRDAA